MVYICVAMVGLIMYWDKSVAFSEAKLPFKYIRENNYTMVDTGNKSSYLQKLCLNWFNFINQEKNTI